jgi:hypothetical protein
MNPEDIKPIYSIGLADLTHFYNEPGRKEVILRTPLMMKETYERRKENKIEPIQPIFEPKEEDLKVNLFGPQTTESGKKEKENVKTDRGGKSNNHTENTQNDVDYIEEAHTYIYYKLKFNESINPKIKDMDLNLEKEEKEEADKNIIENIENKLIIEEETEKIEEKKSEIEEKKENIEEKGVGDEKKIKIEQQKNIAENTRYEKEDEKIKKILEEKEEEGKIEEKEETNIIGADEICSDFRKYIKIFIESICKSYDELIGGDSSKNQAARRDKVGSMISNVKKEERDLNINKFLAKFIESGKANIIK